MKEIKYDGSLIEDIMDADEKLNIKEFFAISNICFVIIATLINVYLFGLKVVPFSLINLFTSTGCLLGAHGLITLVRYIYKKNIINHKSKSAKRRLNVLAHEINMINDTKITKDNIIDAQIKENLSRTKTVDQDGKFMSKQEKIIRYYYLLDNEDKIRVLKEIRKIIKERKTKTEASELQLLEDKDLENKNLPVRKTLVLK